MIRLSLAMILFAGCSTAGKIEESPSVEVKIDDKVTSLSIKELSHKLNASELKIVSHPAYKGKTKTYTGFSLIEVLKLSKRDINIETDLSLEVTTEDGWTAPRYKLKKLIQGNALLAIRESKSSLTKPISKDGKWSLVVAKEKTLYPGPFFIVWNDSGKNPDIMPLQVKEIRIQK